MLNSSDIQKRIDQSPLLRTALAYPPYPPLAKGGKIGLPPPAKGGKGGYAAVRRIYVIILSRAPTPAESDIAEHYFGTKGLQPKQAAADLAWALINSKEFLYRH